MAKKGRGATPIKR